MARKIALVFSLFCGLEDLDFETLHLFCSFKVTKLDYFEIIIKKSKVNINRANVKNVLNRLLSSSWIFFSFLLSLVKLSFIAPVAKVELRFFRFVRFRACWTGLESKRQSDTEVNPFRDDMGSSLIDLRERWKLIGKLQIKNCITLSTFIDAL